MITRTTAEIERGLMDSDPAVFLFAASAIANPKPTPNNPSDAMVRPIAKLRDWAVFQRAWSMRIRKRMPRKSKSWAV